MHDYWVIDYVIRPVDGAEVSKPALLACFAPEREVHGLGVSPLKHELDPRPFLQAFPGETEEVWYFTEWVHGLKGLMRNGASKSEIYNWLHSASPEVLKVREEGRRENLKNIQRQFRCTGRISDQDVLFALLYLIEDHGRRRPRRCGDDVFAVDDSSSDSVLRIAVRAVGIEGRRCAGLTVSSKASPGDCVHARDFDLDGRELPEQLRKWLMQYWTTSRIS